MFKTILLLGVLSAGTANAATPPQPKVVFIGDWITLGWDLSSHSNWINKGAANSECCNGPGTSGDALARFQSDVVSLHPAIVHIMVGAADAFVVYDSGFQAYIPTFTSNLDAMVKEARAANIKVILGMEAQNFELGGNIEPINAVIAAYGAAHNIPVINYGDVLCGCVASLFPGGYYPSVEEQVTTVGYTTGSGSGATQTQPAPYMVPDAPGDYVLVPSVDGYGVMTQMAEAAIATMSLTLKSGYLQNSQKQNPNEGTDGPTFNVNSVGAASIVQFTPQGRYSDGVVRPILNSTFDGWSGIWRSSNPLVMYVNQKGLAWALSPGTATISYTSPNGTRFSPWVMTVGGAPFF